MNEGKNVSMQKEFLAITPARVSVIPSVFFMSRENPHCYHSWTVLTDTGRNTALSHSVTMTSYFGKLRSSAIILNTLA